MWGFCVRNVYSCPLKINIIYSFPHQCYPLLGTALWNIYTYCFRIGETKQIIDFHEGEAVTNRLVTEDEEEELEDVVQLWDSMFNFVCL